jgi:hypothetical protein
VIQIAPEATITITVDAQWMKLPVETITSMRDAISKLEALASGVREYGPAGEEVEAGPSNGSA